MQTGLQWRKGTEGLRADGLLLGLSIFRGEGGFAVVSAGADGEIGTNDDVVRVVSNNKSGLKGQ